MRKTIALAIFAATMLTGCYTNICPTYSVKPVDTEKLEVEKTTDQDREMKDKAS